MIGCDSAACFSCRRQRSSKTKSWGVDIPNLVTEWPSLSLENIIQPTCNVSSFLRTSTNSASASTFISAIHVSARNLNSPCPISLLKSLYENFSDRSTWCDSYYKEKDELLENNMYVEISLQNYHHLRRLPKVVSKAIPSMCVMTIKRYENMAPDRAKSRIVVLGNLENRLWEKGEKYALFLQYSSLRLLTSMATNNFRLLGQGNCNNSFCNANFLADKTTVIKPPSGDLDAKKDVFWLLNKTLYGLGRSQ